MEKYTKCDGTGNALPRDATQWAFVLDNQTGLMWPADDSNAADVTYKQAEKTIGSLNAAKLGGFVDWRLPTIQELLTLVDYTRRGPAIDTDFFKAQNDWYWSSTPAAASPEDCAWIVHFYHGGSAWDNRDGSYRVRAVRSVARASQ